MDISMKMLATAREADMEREARKRRRAALVETCRRWVLGFIPVDQRCDARSA